jgi:hypothetical protein
LITTSSDLHEADFGIGIYTYDSTPMFPPTRPTPDSVAVAYGPIHNLACQGLVPFILPDQGNHIATFFDRHPLMLEIVPQGLFIEYRRLYFTKGILKYGFSWSLEYAIFAVVADLIDPEQAEYLASKAKLILEAEISCRLTNLASTQASVLFGWREYGSPMAGHYSASAAGLIRGFGAYYDPSDFVNTPMTFEEMEARRLMYWSFFVLDREDPLNSGVLLTDFAVYFNAPLVVSRHLTIR